MEIGNENCNNSGFLLVQVLNYRIALKFRVSLISRISRIVNHSQNYFNENFDTSSFLKHFEYKFNQEDVSGSLL